jgi:hypothetical protein
MRKAIRVITKRKVKLDALLKLGFAAVGDQCLQDVRVKLEVINEWEKTQKDKLLYNLIAKIERIHVSFNVHKQEIFILL